MPAERDYICAPGSWVAALISESNDSDVGSLQQLSIARSNTSTASRQVHVVPNRSSSQAAKNAVEDRYTAIARGSSERSPSSFSEPKRLRSSNSQKTGHNLRSSPTPNASRGILTAQHSPSSPLRIRLRRVTTPPPQTPSSRAKRTLFKRSDCNEQQQQRFTLALPANTERSSVAPKRACVEQLEKLDFSPVSPSDDRRALKKSLPDGSASSASVSLALNGGCGRSSRLESLTNASAFQSGASGLSATVGPHEEHDENWILAEVVSHEIVDGRVIYTIFDIDSEDADGYSRIAFTRTVY